MALNKSARRFGDTLVFRLRRLPRSKSMNAGRREVDEHIALVHAGSAGCAGRAARVRPRPMTTKIFARESVVSLSRTRRL